MSDGDELLSLAEAARIAGRAPVSLRRAAAIGTLQATLVGSSWVTTRSDLAAYIAYVSQRAWLTGARRRAVATRVAQRQPRA